MATVRSKEQLAEEKEQKLKEEIERKHGKTVEQLYAEREKRLRDAVELRQPDRVPVLVGGGNFAARYAGLPLSSAYYDVAAYKAAIKKSILDFEPDGQRGGFPGANSGFAFEALDIKQAKWPGGNLPPDVAYQFVEGEYMKADEYDVLLKDPSDFVLRYYLPRVFGIFESLPKLTPLRNLMAGAGFAALTPIFATPEYQKIGKALTKAGQEQEKWRQVTAGFDEELARLGFPPTNVAGGVGGAPFDAVSDFLRGMRGSMIDMYRCPDKLLAACDRILEWRTERASPADPKKRGDPKMISKPLHRGAQGFMSEDQFKKFYWPGLKKAIMTDIDLGFVSMPFFEGRYGDRLEYLLELPKKKVVAHFEHMDMAHAKAVLGNHMCIMGNVPSSLLEFGSPQEVADYCKKLIKDCGKGGGFILSPGSSTDTANPSNIRAMVEAAKKYSPD